MAGGGFVGSYPLPPKLSTLSGPSPASRLAGPTLSHCPAPAVAPRAGCALLVVCWVGGAIDWLAVASGDTLYYYILHYIYVVLCYFEPLITLCLSHLG